jgi:hypothetical protein
LARTHKVLSGSPTSVGANTTVLEPVPLTSTRGETLDSVRDRIQEIEDEIKTLRQALTPSRDLRARIEAYVESLGDPEVEGIEAGQRPKLKRLDSILRY